MNNILSLFISVNTLPWFGGTRGPMVVRRIRYQFVPGSIAVPGRPKSVVTLHFISIGCSLVSLAYRKCRLYLESGKPPEHTYIDTLMLHRKMNDFNIIIFRILFRAIFRILIYFKLSLNAHTFIFRVPPPVIVDQLLIVLR